MTGDLESWFDDLHPVAQLASLLKRAAVVVEFHNVWEKIFLSLMVIFVRKFYSMKAIKILTFFLMQRKIYLGSRATLTPILYGVMVMIFLR